MKSTKKILSAVILILCLGLIAMPINNTAHAEINQTNTQKTLNLYFFYGDGCPHCAKEREFLEGIEKTYKDNISIHEYEIYNNDENRALFTKAGDKLNINIGGVPFLVIGNKHVIGFGGEETTGEKIRNQIDYCLENSCFDPLAELLLVQKSTTESDEASTKNETYKSESDHSEPNDKTDDNQILLEVPLLGEVNLRQMSLPIATTLIAFMDGFNPCAMWILIFLITMLINLEDKRRLYTLGSIFIFTSALMYFIFLAAWFNFFKFVGYVKWVKIAVGIVAIICGLSHLRHGLKEKGGCDVVNKKQRKSIMNRIKKIVEEQSLWLAIIGIITLAVSVNLIELVCSAGLPSIYTSLLSAVNLSSAQYYLYLILYTVIFMLDDLAIFFIAVKTFEVTGITSKYTKYSSLIGGILILIIGILLIFKPEVLMFG